MLLSAIFEAASAKQAEASRAMLDSICKYELQESETAGNELERDEEIILQVHAFDWQNSNKLSLSPDNDKEEQYENQQELLALTPITGHKIAFKNVRISSNLKKKLHGRELPPDDEAKTNSKYLPVSYQHLKTPKVKTEQSSIYQQMSNQITPMMSKVSNRRKIKSLGRVSHLGDKTSKAKTKKARFSIENSVFEYENRELKEKLQLKAVYERKQKLQERLKKLNQELQKIKTESLNEGILRNVGKMKGDNIFSRGRVPNQPSKPSQLQSSKKAVEFIERMSKDSLKRRIQHQSKVNQLKMERVIKHVCLNCSRNRCQAEVMQGEFRQQSP